MRLAGRNHAFHAIISPGTASNPHSHFAVHHGDKDGTN
jgi:hypothetical protein